MSLNAGVPWYEITSLLLDIGNKACLATNSHKYPLAAQRPARANGMLRDRIIIDLSLAQCVT